MELRRYLHVLRRRWPLILAAMIVAVGIAYVTRPTTTTYTATAQIYVGQTRFQNSDAIRDATSDGVTQIANTFAVMISGQPIARQAVERTGVNRSPIVVAAGTKAVVVPKTSLILVAYKDVDAAVAQTLTNGIVDAFVDQIKQFEPGEVLKEGDVPALPAYVSARAQLPRKPDSIANNGTYFVAAVFGFLIAAAVAFVLDHLDLTVRSPEDLERRTGLPVLGVVPLHRPDLGRVVLSRVDELLAEPPPQPRGSRPARRRADA